MLSPANAVAPLSYFGQLAGAGSLSGRKWSSALSAATIVSTPMNNERENLPSASAFRRYELCPGSFQLSAEARRLNQEAHVGGPAAERGELIHAYLAGEVDEEGNEIKLDDSEQTTADFL